MRRCTASEKVSDSTRIGLVAAMASGISAWTAYSTRLADQGAPPTLRRIWTYSMGLATRPWSMLSSSHIDSTIRLCVLVTNRRRHSGDIDGTVRSHRSLRPASAGLAGSGDVSPSAVMNSSSRSRWAFAPARSREYLNCSRKWSSKKNTQTYQSVIRSRVGPSQSGWV